MSSSIKRENEVDSPERANKRTKLDEDPATMDVDGDATPVASIVLVAEAEQAEPLGPKDVLPASHRLLRLPPAPATDDGIFRVLESDVGISEYIGKDVPPIEGIIKQRFTDFLVYEVNLNGETVRIRTLAKPESPKQDKPASAPTAAAEGSSTTTSDGTVTPVEPAPAKPKPTKEEPWPAHFSELLSPYLSEDAILAVKKMYLEGPEAPLVSDGGWGTRPSRKEVAEGEEAPVEAPVVPEPEPEKVGRGKRGRDRGGRGGRGSDRGGRGGRGGGRAGGREDTRKVLSNVMPDKTARAGLHQVVRELFGGKLESETDTPSSGPLPESLGSKIAIKWGKRGGGGARGRGGGGGRERNPRGTFPPYVHFTLQKTNRDTQDALAHLSRILHCNIKDLSVAGTKDKRGVTTQRVSLKRNNKTVEDVWKLANGQTGRKSMADALTQRGERGVRVTDLTYSKASLELGMLKGNAFVITLRNVQVESVDTIDRAMNIIKTKGFINYYGMQRFGTATVPTHAIGLAFLKSEWQRGVDLILQKRVGEHPEVEAARDAWLVEGDLDKALELLPRRVVAERCILESYQKQKGDTRNPMGALSTIPRNLRLMYVHAYQSYVWNAIVSERIRASGADTAVPGDLVFDKDEETKAEEVVDSEMAVDAAEGEVAEEKTEGTTEENPEEPIAESSSGRKGARKPWVQARVKTLTEEDCDKYTIFDVVMPLPGKDVAYPGGALGERYREFLRVDGLDPNNFDRKQKDYALSGSYRHILLMPKELSWSVLRYTDPDVALAQADEDKFLGFDAPVIVEDGKFLALQIQLTLSTAAYATMVLREITKTETSSHFQTGLTQASEDQKFKAGADGEDIKVDLVEPVGDVPVAA